jgi:hypothetical protein
MGKPTSSLEERWLAHPNHGVKGRHALTMTPDHLTRGHRQTLVRPPLVW